MRENLKSEREKLGYTQEQLAVKLGVSEITVRSLENKKRDPSVAMSMKYSRFFSKPLEFLFPDIFLTDSDTKRIEIECEQKEAIS